MLKLLCVFLLIINTSACRKKTKYETNNKLNLSLSTHLDSVDPARSYDAASAKIVYNTYEQLYQYHYLKRPVEIIPSLAEGMPQVSEDGKTVLVLFHVPKFGKGHFKREARLDFPMKKWVKIEVLVGARKGIRVFQSGELVLQAEKDWGPAGPSNCEAHWGLYAEGKTDFAHLLNDDILLKSNGHPK